MDVLQTISENKDKFIAFNNEKFKRFQQLIPNPAMRRIVNTIPFLLCINNKKMPGFVEGEVPLGIKNFTLDDDTMRYLHGRYPGTTFHDFERGDFIKMFAVMGSVGTVAYNKKSDLDYWACIHRNTVAQEAFDNFKKKVTMVQEWASKELEVPVHIFINDIESVKNNIFAEDEEEAFGTTVGAVLKDEFFRSSIIIAGKIPFWWVVPSFIHDDEYDTLYNQLPEDMKRDDYIDLGNLFEISKEDFLGAALFQIIKSLGNPFKSILKIGVLEKYLFGKTDSPLLSQKVKMHVLLSRLTNSILDSYLLMFDEVYDYYSQVINDPALLQILKQNLYLKIDPQLSRYLGIKDKKNIPYKVAVMFKYVHDWSWNLKIIEDMDNFDNWDFQRVMHFWDTVKRFMLMSYQKISAQFNTLNLKKQMSESDFILLSRKIKSYFSVEENKFEKLITFKDTPAEPILYIEPINEGIHEVKWRLFKRNRSEKNVFTTTTLRTENDLVKLLVWLTVNNVYDPSITRINIQSGYVRINQNLVVELLNQMSLFFAGKEKIKNKYYLKPTFTMLHCIILNFNNEAVDHLDSLYHVYSTSWGEQFIKRYNAITHITPILQTMLHDGVELSLPFDDYCLINSPGTHRRFCKNFIQLFKESYKAIVTGKTPHCRFIGELEGIYFAALRNTTVEVQAFDNIVKVLTTLTLKPDVETHYSFYGDSFYIQALHTLYNKRIQKGITIGYIEENDRLQVHIINEKGNIFTFFAPKSSKMIFLYHIYGFCTNVLKRIPSSSRESQSSIICYGVQTDRRGGINMVDETGKIHGDYLLNFTKSKALRVQVARHMGNEIFYNFIFPDNVSSGFMTIKELYSVKHKIAELKKAGIPIYSYIGELVFNDLNQKEALLGSSIYFVEKYKLELMLQRIHN
ncbi:MAG TPA: class I adenylate cyclase [Spirochaetota bacterium]|nr:class I adenylate cyclase [Spirochaetota bacterium]